MRETDVVQACRLDIDAVCSLPNTSGIYCIQLKKDGCMYIGSSKNIRIRARSHIYQLKKNTHHSAFLQSSYNKHGYEQFIFKIIEQCKVNSIIRREQHFLNLEKTKPKTFNICFVAGNCSGVKQSDETKNKRADKLRGSKRTPEQCQRISTARKSTGITPKHQKLLNSISAARRFKLSKSDAIKYTKLHSSGKNWAFIAKEIGVSVKTLRREIRFWIKDTTLLKPNHYKPDMRGSKHPMAKITETDVEYIRNSKEHSKLLAIKYGLTYNHIIDIRHYRCWNG
jgi:group I intron endonuclease